MTTAWDEVQPNHIYQVFKSLPLTEEGNAGLLYLYQPIIGAQALALYYALLGDQADAENEFVHIDLLNALNNGLPDFLQARKRLEGMGLLNVFMKEDLEFGKLFLYQLQEPLHPQAFLKDETYSFLLWQAVGERKFKQTVKRFQPKKIDVSTYQEITSNFSSVYGVLNGEAFMQKAPRLERISKAYETEQPAAIQLAETIDWDFLIDLAKRKYIAAANFTPEFKHQLLLYQNLYGFDELELVDLMTEVVSLTDGKVDGKQLVRLIERRTKTVPQKTNGQIQSEDAEIRRFNTLRQSGFSENDLELIKMSEMAAPRDFLQAIKQEKHSFVTDSETWLLKSLVERSPLANSVINVLMHYVLVVQKNSALQANFVNKIATDWSEIGIKNPEEAIRHVRQLVKDSKDAKAKRTTQRTANYRKPIRKETLPEWVNNPKEEVENSEQQAAINQRLQEYLKRKEGEN